MKILMLLSSKGGSGKSMLCKIFHKALTKTGLTVGAQDEDPQQHFMKYYQKQTQHDKPDVAIIDTVGVWADKNIGLVENIANIDHCVIVPVKPIEDDIHEAIKLHKRIDDLQVGAVVKFLITDLDQYTDKKPFVDQLKAGGCDVLRNHLSRSVSIIRTEYGTQRSHKATSQVNAVLNEVGFL